MNQSGANAPSFVGLTPHTPKFRRDLHHGSTTLRDVRHLRLRLRCLISLRCVPPWCRTLLHSDRYQGVSYRHTLAFLSATAYRCPQIRVFLSGAQRLHPNSSDACWHIVAVLTLISATGKLYSANEAIAADGRSPLELCGAYCCSVRVVAAAAAGRPLWGVVLVGMRRWFRAAVRHVWVT